MAASPEPTPSSPAAVLAPVGPLGAAVAHAQPDRCPGSLRPFRAADGLIARVRLAGRPLTVAQTRGLADLSDALDEGAIHFTTRANVQVRGLDEDGAEAFAEGVADLDLLPSPTHERARNIVVSPLAGDAVLALAAALDRAVCADPDLADLSGRFLVGVDDGGGEVLALPLDIALQVHGDRFRLALGSDPRGYDAGHVGDPQGVAATVVALARSFVRLAATEEVWNVADLSLDLADELHGAAEDLMAAAGSLRVARVLPELAGAGEAADGTHWLAARAPLAEISTAGWRVAADVAERADGAVRVTPWHAVVVGGVATEDVEPALARLAATGWVVSGESPWTTLHGCTGAPRCARSRSDVREHTRELAAAGTAGTPVMVSGCERRCGHPPVPHLSAVATGPDTYEVTVADGTHGPQPAPFATVGRAALPGLVAGHAWPNPTKEIP